MSPALVAIVAWIVGPPALLAVGLLVTWPERRRNVERARRRSIDHLDFPVGNVAGLTTTRREVA